MEGTYWLCKHDWRCRSNRNRPASCSPSAVHRSITRQLALIPQRLIWCMRLTGYLRSLLSLAVAGLRLTFPNPGSQLSVIAFVSWWTWWGCRLSTKGQTPARSTLSTTFLHTCWESSPFRGPVRFGAVTSLTFPSKTAFCTWWRSLIGRSTGFELAAFEYARYQLLCWGAGGGYRKIWQARNYEHGLEQPIHRCCLNHDFDQGQLYNFNAFR